MIWIHCFEISKVIWKSQFGTKIVYVPHLFADFISAWSNQGSVICLVYILYGSNIYLSIYVIIQLEINP